jgi:hypothetical protein
MFKLHIPHRESGYIIKVAYQETTDAAGGPDWEMLYTPGPKAIAEFEAFARRQVRRNIPQAHAIPAASTEGGTDEEVADSNLLYELTRRGIVDRKARELLANLKPGQEVRDQLEYVDHVVARDGRRKLENPPGLYVLYIRDNILPPAGFSTERTRRLHAQAKADRAGEEARLARARIEYEAYCAAEITRFIREEMPCDEFRQLTDRHLRQVRSLLKHMGDEEVAQLAENMARTDLRQSGRVSLPSFADYLPSPTLETA